MAYPVSITVPPALTNRDRLTVGFRIILAIPHLILVGGVGIGFGISVGGRSRESFASESGILGAVAFVLAVINWFAIVFTGRELSAIREFTTFYMRWRVRALAYLMLLEDRYPPFGDAPYPASIEIAAPTVERDRLTVGLRLLLAIPHFIVLVLLVVAWWFAAIVTWIILVASGECPAGLYDFGVGVLRWLLRVEAYVLLLVDEYPPFSMTA